MRSRKLMGLKKFNSKQKNHFRCLFRLHEMEGNIVAFYYWVSNKHIPESLEKTARQCQRFKSKIFQAFYTVPLPAYPSLIDLIRLHLLNSEQNVFHRHQKTSISSPGHDPPMACLPSLLTGHF
jgi:hypothetical protein